MVAVLEDLGRVARERGIEGGDLMFTSGNTKDLPQNCCFPGCTKKVYEEDGVKISFHKFTENHG